MYKFAVVLGLLALAGADARGFNTQKNGAFSSALQVRGGGGPVGDFISTYDGWVARKPILTKALTSLVGFAIGDMLAQLAIEKVIKFNWRRFLRMTTFGFLLHGTTGHYFYNWLDGQIPGTAPLEVAAKVAIDQTIWAPIFMCMFFAYGGVFDNNVGGIGSKIRADTFTAVKGSWITWIPAHTINFAFVPSDKRLLYINAVQIGFNCFMSIIGNKKI